MILDGGKESSRAEGANIETDFSEFWDTLFPEKIVRHEMKRIQIKKHKLGTCEINKTSLSCFDDQRFVLDDGIHTIAYFYKELRKQILTADHIAEEIQNDFYK